MKDAEFIELLNLYVDQEISAADAARLEAEVQANPACRRIYQDYCRMQKACKLLAEDFKTQAAPASEDRVIAFSSPVQRAPRMGQWAAIGSLAAAACAAIIFVNRDQGVPASPSTPVVQSAPPAVAPSEVRGTDYAARMPAAQPVALRNSLLLSSQMQADAIIAAAAEQADSQFAWMRTVQLPPLPPRTPLEANIRFETPAFPLEGIRTYGSPPPADGQVEWVGFKFNK